MNNYLDYYLNYYYFYYHQKIFFTIIKLVLLDAPENLGGIPVFEYDIPTLLLLELIGKEVFISLDDNSHNIIYIYNYYNYIYNISSFNINFIY